MERKRLSAGEGSSAKKGRLDSDAETCDFDKYPPGESMDVDVEDTGDRNTASSAPNLSKPLALRDGEADEGIGAIVSPTQAEAGSADLGTQMTKNTGDEIFDFSTAPNTIESRTYATPTRAFQELLVNALDEDVDATAEFKDEGDTSSVTITNAVKEGRLGLTKRSFIYVSDDDKRGNADMTGMFGFGLKDALTIMCFNREKSFEYSAVSKAGRFELVHPDHDEDTVSIHHRVSEACDSDTVTQVISCSDSPFLEKTFKAAKSDILYFAPNLKLVAKYLHDVTTDGTTSKIGIELYIRENGDVDAPFDNAVYCHNIKYEPGGPSQKKRKFAFVYNLKMPKKKLALGRDRLELPHNWTKFLSSQLMRAMKDPQFLKVFAEHFDRVRRNVDNENLWFAKQTELTKTYCKLLRLRREKNEEIRKKAEEIKSRQKAARQEEERLHSKIEQAEKVLNKCPKEQMECANRSNSPSSIGEAEAEDSEADDLAETIVAETELAVAKDGLKKLREEEGSDQRRLTTFETQLDQNSAFDPEPVLMHAGEAQAFDTPGQRAIPMPAASIEKAKTQGHSPIARILSGQNGIPDWMLEGRSKQEERLLSSVLTKINRICEAMGWCLRINKRQDGRMYDAPAEISDTNLLLNLPKDILPNDILDLVISAIVKNEKHATALIRSLVKNSDSPPGSPLSKRSNAQKSLLLVIDLWSTEKGGIASFNMQLAQDIARGHRVYVLVTEWDETTDQAAKENVHKNLILVQPYKLGSNWPMPYLPTSESSIGAIVGHAHITGPLAHHISKQPQFKDAQFWIVNHCASGWFNSLKANYSYSETLKKEQDLVNLEKEADVVWSVGPTIEDYFKQKFRENGMRVAHFRFQPTLNSFFLEEKKDAQLPETGAQRCTLLLFGRLDDETAKGVPIGIATFKALYSARKERGQARPQLIIRGIKDDTECQQLKERYDLHQFDGSTVDLRLFGTPSDIKQDLRTADLVLMPSHIEPYGLVGLESLAMGVPVLCNEESGLAKDLLRIGGTDLSRPFIVPGLSEKEWVRAATHLLESDASLETSPSQRACQIRQKFLDLPRKDHGHVRMMQELTG